MEYEYSDPVAHLSHSNRHLTQWQYYIQQPTDRGTFSHKTVAQSN